MSEWETGRSRPGWRQLRPLADALGVTLGEVAEAIDATPEHDGSDHRKVPDAKRQAVRRGAKPPAPTKAERLRKIKARLPAPE